MVRLALALAAALAAAPPAAGAAASCEIERVERIVAVGDVHGAYDRYVEILRAAGVVDERQRWSGGRTHLVQLGDVLDRGADSRKALDLLRRLEKEAGRAKGAVHVLLGNHEVMRMIGDLRYVAPGEYAAFATQNSEQVRERLLERVKPELRDQARKETPLGLVEMSLAFGPEGEYGKWLRGLNAVVKINGIVFLHGGISPAVAELPCGEINATVRREITSDIAETVKAPLLSLAGREDGPLWYRGLAQQPEEAFAPQVDEILEKQKARAIVIAHTVAPKGRILARFGGKVLQIDTGMLSSYVPDGRASALEIKDGRFTAIYLDRRDVLPGPPPPAPEARPGPQQCRARIRSSLVSSDRGLGPYGSRSRRKHGWRYDRPVLRPSPNDPTTLDPSPPLSAFVVWPSDWNSTPPWMFQRPKRDVRPSGTVTMPPRLKYPNLWSTSASSW